MRKEYKGPYIRTFYNLAYGKCYVINETDDYHLLFVEKNFMNYIVCTYIDKMGTLLGQDFFVTLDEAREYFNMRTNRKTHRLIKTIESK